jgi:pimeloyl-ACP methyl ester carboxylesterase
MKMFVDLTGRAGPDGWQLGTYPEGSDDLPVSGVSWYEAAAYAEFAGKNLPTVYEWYAAAGIDQGQGSDILPLSNFNRRGPSAAGSHRGMARFGSYDMAGNVKEWTMNARDESRYVLGGAWNDVEYIFHYFEALPPFDRWPTVGFRLVKHVTTPPASAFDPVRLGASRAPREPPVDDKVFKIYLDLHAYDKTDLESRVERVVDAPDWRRETVSFRAAYGTERVVAHLFLPTHAARPYQIVAFFGHSGIVDITRIEDLRLPYEFVVRSGRALIIPAFSGTLDRGPTPFELPDRPAFMRDRALQWSKDLGRSLDYLETRAEIDINKLAFYGVSLGAAEGPRLVAVEPRFKTAVLASGGLTFWNSAPEVDNYNSAPRVRIPVLMLGGRQDLIFPMETDQKVLFEAFGNEKSEKVFSEYDGSHANLLTRPELIGEILDWLDTHLGPVDHVR